MPKDNGQKFKSNDPYNGDDGPPFDEEFRAMLLCGAHLFNDNDSEYFQLGWKSCKQFMEKKNAPVQREQPVPLVDAVREFLREGEEVLDPDGWTAMTVSLDAWHNLETAFNEYEYTTQPVQREQQEPVAWALMHKKGLEFNTGYGMVKTLQEAEDMQRWHFGNLKVVSLYTTPPSVEAAVKAMRDKVETIAHNIGEFAGGAGSQEQCDTLNGYVTELFAAIRGLK